MCADIELDRPKFSTADICRLFAWSYTTLLRRLPELPHYRIGRSVRFSERHVQRIFRSFEQPGKGVFADVNAAKERTS